MTTKISILKVAIFKYTVFKGKGKVVPVLFFLTDRHAIKAYWGSGDIVQLIL
jgi:hypothetical protein